MMLFSHDGGDAARVFGAVLARPLPFWCFHDDGPGRRGGHGVSTERLHTSVAHGANARPAANAKVCVAAGSLSCVSSCSDWTTASSLDCRLLIRVSPAPKAGHMTQRGSLLCARLG